MKMIRHDLANAPNHARNINWHFLTHPHYHLPGALTTPYLVVGGTDARHYAPVTENAFRFSPNVLDPTDTQRVHAVNERRSFENTARMASFYIAFLQEMVSRLNGSA